MPPTYNLTRFFEWRWNQAVAKFDTGLDDEAVESIQDLLAEEHLPWLLRLKGNMVLVDAIYHDWYLAEQYRLDAEEVYEHIRKMYPVGDTEHPVQEAKLVSLRADLDTLLAEQIDNKPLPGEMEEVEEEEEEEEGEEEEEEEDTLFQVTQCGPEAQPRSHNVTMHGVDPSTSPAVTVRRSSSETGDYSVIQAQSTHRGPEAQSRPHSESFLGSILDDPFTDSTDVIMHEDDPFVSPSRTVRRGSSEEADHSAPPSLTDAETEETSSSLMGLSIGTSMTSPFATPVASRFRQVATDNPVRIASPFATPAHIRYGRPATDHGHNQWSTPMTDPITPLASRKEPQSPLAYKTGSGAGVMKRLPLGEDASTGSPAKRKKGEPGKKPPEE